MFEQTFHEITSKLDFPSENKIGPHWPEYEPRCYRVSNYTKRL